MHLILITIMALFYSALGYLIMVGRVENVWMYVAVIFVVTWMGSATLVSMAVSSGKADERMGYK